MAFAGAPHVAPAGASGSPILTFVQDSDNDLLGHNATTLALLEVDPANLQASQPGPICDGLNQEFHNGVFNGLGMLGDNGRLALIFAPMVATPSALGQLNHPDEGKFVGILGDLYQGNHHDYHIKTQNPCPFEQIPNTVPCLSADLIHNAAHAHTGANLFTVGPHQHTDVGVTPTHTRKIFKIPFFLLQHFIAIPDDADVAHYFWSTIFPLIQAEGREVELKSLIDYFRVAATLEAADSSRRSVWNTEDNMPTPIGRNVSLMQYRGAALRRNFPSVFVDIAAASLNQQMGAMAAAQDEANRIARDQLEFHKEQKASGELEKIHRVCGEEQLQYMLNALGINSRADLPKFLKEALNTSPKDSVGRDRILQRELKAMALRKSVEAPYIMSGTMDRIFRGVWHMESDSEPETGSLCNTFLWGPPKEMAKQSQELARLHANENINVTKGEQEVLEKSVLFFTHLDHIERLITDGYILWLTMTDHDLNHPVVKFLDAYRGRISMNKVSIQKYPLIDKANVDIIGILIQIRLSKHLELWSRKVALNMPPPALNDKLIIETVTNGGPNNASWEVWSTTLGTLESDYGKSLKVFRNAGRRTARSAAQDDFTVVGTLADDMNRYGMIGGAVRGNQKWRDNVSQIPENWSARHKCTAECIEVYHHVDQPAARKEELKLKQWVQTEAQRVPPRLRGHRRRGGNQSADE